MLVFVDHHYKTIDQSCQTSTNIGLQGFNWANFEDFSTAEDPTEPLADARTTDISVGYG